MVETKGFFNRTYACDWCGQEFTKLDKAEKHEDKCNLIPEIFDAGVFDPEGDLKKTAEKHERLLEFDEAAEIYKKLGKDEEVIRVRKLKAEQGAVKVDQTVVQGDQITKTEIKDSVLNRSNVGSGGDDKFTKLKELTEMKEKGLISDEEYEKMKQEIIG